MKKWQKELWLWPPSGLVGAVWEKPAAPAQTMLCYLPPSNCHLCRKQWLFWDSLGSLQYCNVMRGLVWLCYWKNNRLKSTHFLPPCLHKSLFLHPRKGAGEGLPNWPCWPGCSSWMTVWLLGITEAVRWDSRYYCRTNKNKARTPYCRYSSFVFSQRAYLIY